MSGTGNINDIRIVFFDQPIQMNVNEVLSRGSSPVPNRPKHGPKESGRSDTSHQLSDEVARNSLPREVASHRESQRDYRIQMRSAHFTHKIDDRHDHESRRHHHHAQGDSATAHRGNDTTTGSNQYQQEGAPSLCEHASPLKGCVEKIRRRLPCDDGLCCVRPVLCRPFHVLSCVHCCAGIALPNANLAAP